MTEQPKDHPPSCAYCGVSEPGCLRLDVHNRLICNVCYYRYPCKVCKEKKQTSFSLAFDGYVCTDCALEIEAACSGRGRE